MRFPGQKALSQLRSNITGSMLQLHMKKKKKLKAFMQASRRKFITPQNMIIITGDWNEKVGNKAETNVAGKYGLGTKMN